MPVEIAQESAIQAWINQYGNIVFFFGQLAFWLALAIAAIYAVVLFKKLVDHTTGADVAKADTSADAAKADSKDGDKADSKDGAKADSKDGDKPVKVEDFVE